jgi:hypothetical protein
MFAFPAARVELGDKLGDGFGLAGVAAGSAAFVALAVLAAGLLLVSAPSFVRAKSGATSTAASSELQSHLFRFIIYFVLLNREPFIEIGKRDSPLAE